MFTSVADLDLVFAAHRRELLADADNFRLARLARRARRAARTRRGASERPSRPAAGDESAVRSERVELP